MNNLMIQTDYVVNLFKASLEDSLIKFNIDQDRVSLIQDKVNLITNNLISQRTITSAISSCKVVDDKVVIDMGFQPTCSLNYIKITINSDLVGEVIGEDKEREFQIYIENKPW